MVIAGDAKIFQWLNPLRENWGNRGIALQINSADFSAAVVQIEIRGQFLMLRFELDGAGGVAVVLGDSELVWLVRTGDEAEVLLHVAVGAELAFFFAGP
jgi:hypothetical protein